MKSNQRLAKTKSGKLVQLDTLTETATGWAGFIIGAKGYAVSVFVPKN